MGKGGEVCGGGRATKKTPPSLERGKKKGKKDKGDGCDIQDETACDSPSAPLFVRIEPVLFKDDSLSVGGSLKSSGKVLKYQREVSKDRQPNVNCRVEAFGRVCHSFDDKRRRWVSAMGFEGLLNLADMCLPHNLCYWLFTRVDPVSGLFIAPDGKEFSITPNQVSWVLGLTRGRMPIPHVLRGSAMKGRAREIEERYVVDIRYTVKKSGKDIRSSCIPVTSQMLKRLEGTWDDSEKEEFKLLFLVVACGLVLTPTLNGKMTYNMLPALACYPRAYLFDWAKFVLDRLFRSVLAFSRQFYKRGSASGCGGCSIFLAIFYLDRLNRQPVCWGVWPRIKAWNMEEISIARSSDRVNGGGDYGKLGCIDLVYGEDHPKSRIDHAAPNPVSSDNMSDDNLDDDYVIFGDNDPSELTVKPTLRKRRRRGRKWEENRSNDVPFADVNMDNEDVQESQHSPSEVDPSAKLTLVSDPMIDVELSFPKLLYRHSVSEPPVYDNGYVPETANGPPTEHNPFNGFLYDNGYVPETANGPATEGVVDYYDLLISADSIEDHVDSGSRKLSIEQLSSVITIREERAKRQLVRFVREEGRLRSTHGDEVIMIACGSHKASLNTCYSVLHGRRGLSDEFVRTVGVLFNQMWMRKHLDSCIRHFVDPLFAMKVLHQSTSTITRIVVASIKERLIAKAQHEGVGYTVSDISEVFIPVLEPLKGKEGEFHWWALGVSLASEKIFVIDSNTLNGSEDHSNEIDVLLTAMDSVLNMVDCSNWELGQLKKFEKLNLNIQLQPDIHSSGVFVLLAIFECAIRIPSQFKLDDVAWAREWLLALTVLLRENEVVEDVRRLIVKE